MSTTKQPTESNYYVMSCEGFAEATMIGTFPKIPGPPWMAGQPVKGQVPEPLVFELDPDYPGELKPFYKGRIPVMRDDLVAVLNGSGVDNVQYFAAVLRDPFRNTDHKDFKAFNIVGAITAADLKKSKKMFAQASKKVDVAFDTLALDESKIGGPLMFRLAESVNAIIVHRRIKQAVEEAGVPGMTFYKPEDWAG